MAHSVCSSDGTSQRRYFQRLWRTLSAPNVEPETRLERLFERETAEFDTEFGYLSYIDRDNGTQRFVVLHGTHEVFEQGSTVPLSKTYCRKTITDPEGTLAIDDAPAEGWRGDPAYEISRMESYLGTTVSAEDQLYGTLCFVDPDAREEPFLEEEKALLELHSEWVGHMLSLWTGPLIRETPLDTLEERVVSSEDIDGMMDALKRPVRRLVLMTLLGESTEVSMDTLERRMTDENDRIQLNHSALPRLDDAGYITWDRDRDTVSRGPKFPDVEPLVELLEEYETELLE